MDKLTFGVHMMDNRKRLTTCTPLRIAYPQGGALRACRASLAQAFRKKPGVRDACSFLRSASLHSKKKRLPNSQTAGFIKRESRPAGEDDQRHAKDSMPHNVQDMPQGFRQQREARSRPQTGARTGNAGT